MHTGYPPEPILTEAAARILFGVLLPKAYVLGELVARLLVTFAYDLALEDISEDYR